MELRGSLSDNSLILTIVHKWEIFTNFPKVVNEGSSFAFNFNINYRKAAQN
jgi:hypothetical protein